MPVWTARCRNQDPGCVSMGAIQRGTSWATIPKTLNRARTVHAPCAHRARTVRQRPHSHEPWTRRWLVVRTHSPWSTWQLFWFGPSLAFFYTNEGPTAADDTASALGATTVDINVLANDFGRSNLTIISVGSADIGSQHCGCLQRGHSVRLRVTRNATTYAVCSGCFSRQGPAMGPRQCAAADVCPSKALRWGLGSASVRRGCYSDPLKCTGVPT